MYLIKLVSQAEATGNMTMLSASYCHESDCAKILHSANLAMHTASQAMIQQWSQSFHTVILR